LDAVSKALEDVSKVAREELGELGVYKEATAHSKVLKMD
jgi:hypothetical protein